MKNALSLAVLLLSFAGLAAPVRASWGYDSVVIDPSEPTSLDPVRIVVEGDWTCPRLSGPEVVGWLVVLSFDVCGSLAPPTHHVFERFVAPLDAGPYTLVMLDNYSGTVLHQQGFEVTDTGTRLWPTFVRFTTSMVEVWVERVETGEVKYYRLAPTVPGGDELEAGFDREGFEP